jgi:hypothetical protein
MACGYLFEGSAFIMYPLNFKHFLLRNVIITWSGCSNIIAFVGGVLLYEEPMTCGLISQKFF